MAITRRQFITRTGLITAGSFLGPGFFRNPFLQRALASAMGDKYLVILQADGGNDGLNTVIPYDDGTSGALRSRYQVVRTTGSGGLQIPAGTTLDPTLIGTDPHTATPLALHPGLTGFKALSDLGKLAVIQGCGYPNQNLSHDQSKDFWQTGDPLNVIPGNAGWMGRYLVASMYGNNDISSVNIRSTIANEFVQNATNVLAFSRLNSFTFPYDTYSNSDKTFKQTAYAALCAAASGASESTMQYLGNSGSATLTASQKYPPIDGVYKADRPTWDTGYSALNSSMANDLREVAKVIYAVENQLDPAVNARFFQVRNSGYDTHSNQGGVTGAHNNLHVEVGNAVEQFYNDLDNMTAMGGGKVSDKVCIVWWSEFSRRITQNSSGTDHGSQGPMFVVGGAVNGGVYGNHPNINVLNSQGNTSYSQSAADPYRSTDLRDVFGTILKHWLGLANPISIFPLDTGSPNTFWTTANFDMGFLP
jgi:uncharacterized protein (DUF1501 family)